VLEPPETSLFDTPNGPGDQTCHHPVALCDDQDTAKVSVETTKKLIFPKLWSAHYVTASAEALQRMFRYHNIWAQMVSDVTDNSLQLAGKAKTNDGYVIQIIGYAASVGSATLNQKLSEDGANSITTFPAQQDHIPLTNMLAPGAMGESRQVCNDSSAEGQAENRRVVVRVMQNKGIARR
jgi:hypothetical protein